MDSCKAHCPPMGFLWALPYKAKTRLVAIGVTLIEMSSDGRANLSSSRVDRDGIVRFHKAGTWWTNEVEGAGAYMTSPLFPDIETLYSDLQGRELLVTANDNWPFFKLIKHENGTVVPGAGVDPTVVDVLSSKFNFTYRVVTPPDGKWGGPQPDGTITGIIGMVARHEAHLAICELTVTAAILSGNQGIRETVVDFTSPYYMESTTLVSRAPKEKNRAFAVFSPFRAEVWLCICISTVLIAPASFLIGQFIVGVFDLKEGDTGPYHSLHSLYFNMYRSLMVQGNRIMTRCWPLRLTFYFWYLFCFCVYEQDLRAAMAERLTTNWTGVTSLSILRDLRT
ncbi:glutamate receptor ionotropic, delta-2-like [Penaeus chinensis]|uniref:glutamate receptor ionotropic, delta-2-like n=1 Tax=Penaeus chinensis TaxID=139456 RepID=UPI001FB62575|nr:glutamate receptor ionotropic, delta-2-like [Penaeus chinensis]